MLLSCKTGQKQGMSRGCQTCLGTTQAISFAPVQPQRRCLGHGVENKFMFLGSWAFWASGAFRHFQLFSENTIRLNQAFSGTFRHVQVVLHDLPRFHMILHDPFGAQEPRNVSTDGKNMASAKMASAIVSVSTMWGRY